MITSHLSSVWTLLSTFVVGFLLGAVVQAAYAKWKLRRDLDLTGDPEPMEEWNLEQMSDQELYEKFGLWQGEGLPPEIEGHLIRSRLQQSWITPRNRRK